MKNFNENISGITWLSELEPDWGEWNLRPAIHIWEAAALTLNIDPNCFRRREGSNHGEVALSSIDVEVKYGVLVSEEEFLSLVDALEKRIDTLKRAGSAHRLGKQISQHSVLNDWSIFESNAVVTYLRGAGANIPIDWNPGGPSGASPRRSWPWRRPPAFSSRQV